MTGPPGIFTNEAPWFSHWLLESFFSATVLFAVGLPVVLRVKSTLFRQRLAEGILLAALLTAILATIPGIRPWSLGIIAAGKTPPAPVVAAKPLHIGLIRHFASTAGRTITTAYPPTPDHALSILTTCRRGASLLWAGFVARLPVKWIEVLYAAGVSIAVLRLLAAAYLLRRLVRRSCTADPTLLADWHNAIRPLPAITQAGGRQNPLAARLRVSRDINSPITFGIWRRHVLIPQAMARHCSRETLVAIFRHEAAHLSRRDGLSQILTAAAGTIYFYHPLAHLLCRRIGRDRELIADNAAADLCGGPLAYAQQLVNAAKMCPARRPAAMALGLFGRQSDLRARIVQLTHPARGSMQAFSARRLAAYGLCLLAAAAGISRVTLRARAADSPVGISPARIRKSTLATTLLKSRRRGIAFLRRRQDTNGAWLGRYGPAVTALVIKALIQDGYSTHSAPVRRGLDFIESRRHANGGFYGNTEPLYNTAIVMRTLADFHSARIEHQITAARAFLCRANSVPNRAIALWFAGQSNAGAGQSGRLSDGAINGQSRLLRRAVRMAEHPTILAAPPAAPAGLTFAANGVAPLPFAAPLDNHERSAHMRLANYGNITYSQLKSMVYAGLTAHDVRTRRLLAWLKRNYTLAVNPAEGSTRGLFYYYLTTAEVLRVSGNPLFTDSRGIRHNWRREFTRCLTSMQHADGSWQNRASGSWLEGNRIMATTYAVLTLEELRH